MILILLFGNKGDNALLPFEPFHCRVITCPILTLMRLNSSLAQGRVALRAGVCVASQSLHM